MFIFHIYNQESSFVLVHIYQEMSKIRAVSTVEKQETHCACLEITTFVEFRAISHNKESINQLAPTYVQTSL